MENHLAAREQVRIFAIGPLLPRCPNNADIVDRTVVVVGHLALYAVGNVHTINDFAKDGVQAVEVGRAAATGDNVELAGAAAVLGVDIVAFTGCCHRAAPMDNPWRAELWFQGVTQVAIAQFLSRLCRAAVGVTSLNHEVIDDAVEEQRVVEVLVHQLQEVVAVDGGLVVEGYADVALSSLDDDLWAHRRRAVLCIGHDAGHYETEENQNMFHACKGTK